MWFAKLFGGQAAVEDDEPARFSAPESLGTAPPAQRVRSTVKQVGKQAAKGGFDPYNSGSFEKGKAWERVVIRR